MPPKIAILVLWRSFMSVLNIAHVDAQFALPTIAMFLRGARCVSRRALACRLEDVLGREEWLLRNVHDVRADVLYKHNAQHRIACL